MTKHNIEIIRFFLFHCIFLILSLNVNAQFHKKFIKENGSIAKDSTKAYGYILYQKIGQDQDSVWSVIQYNKRHIPILKGHYLDEDFTIPHGKFTFYQEATQQKKSGNHASTIDTIIYISEVGFFNNGAKDGIWIEFFSDGTKHFIKNFENNKLNGLVEEYSFNGKLYSRGTFIDGTMEGQTYIFRPDSSIQAITYFKNGKQIANDFYGENDQMFGAYPGYNFEYYIYKYLKKLAIPSTPGNVMIVFTIDENGNLIKPKIALGINPAIDNAILECIVTCPKWVAATKNKKRIAQNVTIAFNYENKSYDYVLSK